MNLTQTIDEEEPVLMMAISHEDTPGEVALEEKMCDSLIAAGESQVDSEVWYLDNGASNHMTGEISKFHKLDEKVTGHTQFGDGSKINIQGKGSILFECQNGDQKLLDEVYYIPRLKINIISL